MYKYRDSFVGWILEEFIKKKNRQKMNLNSGIRTHSIEIFDDLNTTQSILTDI